MSDQRRNLNPIAPARVAMAIWGDRYAAQKGGAMDFWDTLGPGDKKLCVSIAEKIREAPMWDATASEYVRRLEDDVTRYEAALERIAKIQETAGDPWAPLNDGPIIARNALARGNR